MPEPISKSRPLLLPCVALLLVSIALIGGTLTSSAQSPGSEQRQRPRRVGTNPAPSPSPKSQVASGEEIDDGDVIRVDTQLVSVPAVVTNNAGRPVAGLRLENFQLFENGQPQRLTTFATTEAPFEVALLLDTSGSTRADVVLIRRAANAFIDALRPGDRIAIAAFNTPAKGSSAVATVEILTGLTSDRALLRQAVANLGSSSGTPFYDALERIAGEIFGRAPAPELRGRRAVVALTDGVDSSSNTTFASARARLLNTGVACYFIQVNTEDFVEDRLLKDCEENGRLTLSKTQLDRYRRIFVPGAPPEDYAVFCRLGQFERMHISRELYNLARREMNDLARASGGRNFVAAALDDARAAFAQVANEIGTQYSLGYYPTNKLRDGKYRAIKVEVRGVAGKPQVRAREGYFAPKGE